MSRSTRTLFLALCLPLALLACGDDPAESDAAIAYDAGPPDAVPGSPIGAACKADDDCLGGACYDDEIGFPGGYCTHEDCDVTNPETSCQEFGGDNACVNFGTPEAPAGLCVDLCDDNADCREGYFCVPFAPFFCAPA